MFFKMETKLHSFLKSNLLNKYLVGETTDVESAEVEYFIAKYSEVSEAYETLQNNLEILAKADSQEAPSMLLDTIYKNLELSEKPKVIKMASDRKTPWYSIAASAAAIIFSVTSFTLYQKIKI
jgi:hypothetical protein